ncbi:PIN domain-containing protein [Methylobacterium sp. NFXW15]|uniref:PIN domain-containing protein n=1 Tax=Methylobacterium sp. NFXW15 TaxID=2819512 RepID=UPI003CEB657E
MLRLLIDTCVWLDLAKDYRLQPTLRALEQLIATGDVSLILPRQTVDEFARNKERVVRESGKSLSSTLKRVKEAVRQFGDETARDGAIAVMDDVDHRIVILGEAVNTSIARIERIFADAEVIETTDAVKLRTAQRAIDKLAPFHKGKNSMGDAVLAEIYRDALAFGDDETVFSFVTHNKLDFSDMSSNERQPHPDLTDLFVSDGSTYWLSLGECLNDFASEWMEDVNWEFEYQDEPRKLSEIIAAQRLLLRQIWYNRHWNLRCAIDSGEHRVVTHEEWDANPGSHQDMTVDSIWAGALAAAKRTEDEVGLENLGPWDDFEWGMLNGKLSALRWVLGSEWDFLDT